MKEKPQAVYIRPLQSRIGDFFYQIRCRLFKDKQKVSKSGSFERQKKVFLFSILFIPLAHWALFWLYVNINSIMLAFQDQRTGVFTLENFSLFWDALTADNGEIGLAIKNTMIYFGNGLLIVFPLSLFISYFIFKRIKFYQGFRIIFYLPAIISGVVMVTVFSKFIDPRGPLGQIASLFGRTIPPEGLLGRAETATTTIVLYAIWTGFSGNVLLFSGAMTRIPTDVLESAKIEGCGPMKEFLYIILPLIWPTISTMIIFAFTGLFTSSGPILLFAPNGEYKTTTLAFWIFKQVYGTGAIGGTGSYNLVSCTGLCFTLIGVPIILTIRWLIEKIPTVEY